MRTLSLDTIFNENVPLVVKDSPRLFPYATIGDFSFTVPKNRFTNRDLTVNMTHGEVRGLDTALQRKEDCREPLFRDGQTVVSCSLAINGLNITFIAQVKGDSLISSWKTIWVNVAVKDSVTHFEAATPTGPGIGSHQEYIHSHDAEVLHISAGNCQLRVCCGHQ
ncbi:hypothetical protein MTO96_019450 [Rhipicephalus appendiculatus]